MDRKRTKTLFVLGVFTTFSLISLVKVFSIQEVNLSPLQEANIEALATNERPPEWWDFFNNYEVEERIPVSTSNCVGGSITFKGVTINVGNCYNYTYVIYHHCYDGGNRSECTSSHVDNYI